MGLYVDSAYIDDVASIEAAAVRYGPMGTRQQVHPGYMPPMLNATNAGERADKIAATPLRRLGRTDRGRHGVLFLASDGAFCDRHRAGLDGGFIAQ